MYIDKFKWFTGLESGEHYVMIYRYGIRNGEEIEWFNSIGQARFAQILNNAG